jgi:WD40 repeat protein
MLSSFAQRAKELNIVGLESYSKYTLLWKRILNGINRKTITWYEGEEDLALTSPLVFVEYKMIGGCFDGHVRIWNQESGECVKTLTGGHTDQIDTILLHKNKIITGSRDKSICIWNEWRIDPQVGKSYWQNTLHENEWRSSGELRKRRSIYSGLGLRDRTSSENNC